MGSVKQKLIFLRPIKKCGDFLLRKTRGLPKLTLVSLIIPALFLLAVGRIFYLVRYPPTYIFSLSASSSFVLIETPKTPAPHKWRINNASICTQHPYATPNKIFVLANPSGKDCGKGWYQYETNDTELTLEFFGHSTSIFEVGENNALYLSVRSINSVADQAAINVTVNNNDTFPIGSKVNLIWRNNKNQDYLVFPFLGSVTVGGDINWSSHGMLDSGTIGIYGSDFSLVNNRKKLDQMELMLGDKITLGSYNKKTGETTGQAKGFIRFEQSSDDYRPSLRIVGFGEANLVNVERYGENGIAYKPTFWSQLLADSWLIVAISILGVIATLVEVIDYIIKKKRSDAD